VIAVGLSSSNQAPGDANPRWYRWGRRVGLPRGLAEAGEVVALSRAPWPGGCGVYEVLSHATALVASV